MLQFWHLWGGHLLREMATAYMQKPCLWYRHIHPCLLPALLHTAARNPVIPSTSAARCHQPEHHPVMPNRMYCFRGGTMICSRSGLLDLLEDPRSRENSAELIRKRAKDFNTRQQDRLPCVQPWKAGSRFVPRGQGPNQLGIYSPREAKAQVS